MHWLYEHFLRHQTELCSTPASSFDTRLFYLLYVVAQTSFQFSCGALKYLYYLSFPNQSTHPELRLRVGPDDRWFAGMFACHGILCRSPLPCTHVSRGFLNWHMHSISRLYLLKEGKVYIVVWHCRPPSCAVCHLLAQSVSIFLGTTCVYYKRSLLPVVLESAKMHQHFHRSMSRMPARPLGIISSQT